jgi:hypothetical protein
LRRIKMKEIEFGRINGEPLVWHIAEQNHKGFPLDTITIIPVSTLGNITFSRANPLDKDHDRRLYGNNRYKDSDVRRYINSDEFLKTVFSPEELDAIVETELKVKQPDIDGGEIDVLRDRLFLLSASEVGLEEGDTEGGVIELFKDGKNRRILDIDGDPDWWWLRSALVSDSCHVRDVNTDGSTDLVNAYHGNRGVRPACNLKISYLVSKGSKRTKGNDSGFPVFNSTRAENGYQCIVPGMTLTKYAAIKLKVPRSGDPELDAMIRESRRADYSERIAAEVLAMGNNSSEITPTGLAERVYRFTDSMFAKWEKEA